MFSALARFRTEHHPYWTQTRFTESPRISDETKGFCDPLPLFERRPVMDLRMCAFPIDRSTLRGHNTKLICFVEYSNFEHSMLCNRIALIMWVMCYIRPAPILLCICRSHLQVMTW